VSEANQIDLLHVPTPESPTEYNPDGPATLEQWAEDGKRYIRSYADLPWKLGSWLDYGESRFGQDCYGALPDAPHYALESLRNFVWVHQRVPGHVRREELSWSHHRVVAKLDMAEQTMWLNRCVDESWTVREFTDAVNPKQLKGRDEETEEVETAETEEQPPGPTFEERRENVFNYSLGRIGQIWRAEDQFALRRLLLEDEM
tara:strand:- start:3323 stop:3928 length:606 start_codon:yes stop_codon:yes gene_type:complete